MTITFQEKAAVQAAVEFFRVASTSSQPVECGVGKNGKWSLSVFDEVRQDEINSRHDAYGDTEPAQIDFTEFTQDEYEALLRVLHKIEYARLVPAKQESEESAFYVYAGTVPKKFESGEVTPGLLKGVLSGRVRVLHAFDWDSTKQGSDYWNSQDDHETLTPEARAIIEARIAELESEDETA